MFHFKPLFVLESISLIGLIILIRLIYVHDFDTSNNYVYNYTARQNSTGCYINLQTTAKMNIF